MKDQRTRIQLLPRLCPLLSVGKSQGEDEVQGEVGEAGVAMLASLPHRSTRHVRTTAAAPRLNHHVFFRQTRLRL